MQLACFEQRRRLRARLRAVCFIFCLEQLLSQEAAVGAAAAGALVARGSGCLCAV